MANVETAADRPNAPGDPLEPARPSLPDWLWAALLTAGLLALLFVVGRASFTA